MLTEINVRRNSRVHAGFVPPSSDFDGGSRPRRTTGDVKNYEQINTLSPAGIGKKNDHITGGGISGPSAAAFLVDDAHMPANRITAYESLGVVDAP